MAGVITHMGIAHRVLELLPVGTIKNENLFYMGSIAPDQIRMRKNCVREDKKHAHLRDGIADMELRREKNLELFHSRVREFILRNIEVQDELLDLYRGYLVHVLSDEVFLLNVRPDFVEKMYEIDIEPTNIIFRDKLFHDLDSHDYAIIEGKKDISKVIKNLSYEETYDIGDYITGDEIKRGIDSLIEKYLKQEHENLEPVYISDDIIKRYIDEAARDIIKRLSDGVVFSRVF